MVKTQGLRLFTKGAGRLPRLPACLPACLSPSTGSGGTPIMVERILCISCFLKRTYPGSYLVSTFCALRAWRVLCINRVASLGWFLLTPPPLFFLVMFPVLLKPPNGFGFTLDPRHPTPTPPHPTLLRPTLSHPTPPPPLPYSMATPGPQRGKNAVRDASGDPKEGQTAPGDARNYGGRSRLGHWKYWLG